MSIIAQAVKNIAQSSVEYSKPVELQTGKVETINPLTIRLNVNVPPLEEDELILLRSVVDYEVDIEVSHKTEDEDLIEGQPTDFKKHNHKYKGRKKIKIYNGLLVGEGVLLIRQQGGQKFVVVDRLVPHTVSGEWL